MRRHDQHIHSLYGPTRVAWQHRNAGQVCGLESCPSRHQQHVGVIIKTRIRITGNCAMEPEKGQCLNHSRHFSGVVGVSSRTCKSKMSLGGWGDRATAPHPAKVSPLTRRVHPSEKMPILGSHCLFRVLWYECWRDADIWLWASASGSSDAGLQACVLLGRFPGMRERRQE